MDASNDRFSYLSEPTTPTKCAKEGFFFYSLPVTPGNSPSPSASPSPYTSQPATPCLSGDAYSSFDVFEFETSRRFQGRIGAENHQGRQLGIPLPEMTFAEELFSNGKVLPLLPPLKLPPRLQQGTGNSGIKKSTTASSPRSPISILKSKISRNKLFDADFDPFTAALENVRNDGANSLSPARTLGQKAHIEANMGFHSPLLAHEAIGPRPSILHRSGCANLKGLATTKKLRREKMEFESKVGPLVDPVKKKKETREPALFRRLESKKPIKSDITKLPRVPCRIRFPLCLGFGSRYC